MDVSHEAFDVSHILLKHFLEHRLFALGDMAGQLVQRNTQYIGHFFCIGNGRFGIGGAVFFDHVIGDAGLVCEGGHGHTIFV